jgi:hypothetical protein
MLETPRITVHDAASKGVVELAPFDAQVHTSGGLQGCRLISSIMAIV